MSFAMDGIKTFRIGEVQRVANMPETRKAFITVIRSRADLGIHAFIDQTLLIGRDPNCAMALHDHAVSWHHAEIRVRKESGPSSQDHYVIEDLGSTNGTRVNSVPVVTPTELHDGDKICLGDTVLRFALADEFEISFQNEIATLVGTDPLTGLESKRRFDEALDFALRSAKSTDGFLTVMMMDMDGVKQINDQHGHLFGAHVIAQTGRILDRVLGSRGHACRFGGDEFSAFIPNCDLRTGRQVAERIRQAVETAEMEKDGIALRPTISIGLACFPDSGTELLPLISAADEALYRAKREGKNRVASF